MASLFIYDVNNYIKLDSTLQNIAGKNNIIIQPAVGDEDNDAPFLVWTYYPGIRNPDLPWWRTDKYCYYIFDTNADRCIAMGERIIDLLSVSDKAKAVPSSYFIGQWSFLTEGSFSGPAKKDGWYIYEVHFLVSHLPM